MVREDERKVTGHGELFARLIGGTGTGIPMMVVVVYLLDLV